MPRKPRKSDILQSRNPREETLEHRNFLARALTRNDAEITALIKVNDSLQKAKESILQSCGELVLLDLGAGRLTLINDELHEETIETDDEVVHHLSPAQKHLCVDFMLRMKLRRKLSNRLARRLNRVAHAMDGEDVGPPPPPRYGDLSLNIDPAAVNAKEAHWKLLEDAKERLSKAKLEGSYIKADSDVEGEAPSSEDKMDQDGAQDSESVKKELDSKEEPHEQVESQAVAGQELPEEEKGPDFFGQEASTEMAPTSGESKPSENEQEEPDTNGSAKAGEGDEKENGTKDPVSSLERDQEILKVYNDAYEKIWDAQTKTFTYSILDHDQEPDYNAIDGVGVGSTSRPMSVEEKELEHLRWQTAVLARIPRQPTFEELGRENQVFCFEERRKRCLEEVDRDGEAEETEIKKAKGENDDDTETVEPEKGSENDSETNEADEEMSEDEGKKISLEKTTKSPEKQKDVMEQKAEEEFKEVRPMSLAAIPSFYNQDMKRLRLIHLDLVKQSIDHLSRAKLTRTIEKYNEGKHIFDELTHLKYHVTYIHLQFLSALYKSAALFNRRSMLHTRLAISVETGRSEIGKATSEYALRLTIAKQKWLKEKQEHDAKRLKALLPSSYGQLPMGTVAIQNFCRSSNKPHSLVVGSCLADIVDSIVMTAEGKLPAGQQFPDFVPPPKPTVPQQRLQEQAAIKKEGSDVIGQLTHSENMRKVIWKSLMKLKAETELKFGMISRRTAQSNTHLPMPALNRASKQALPNLSYAFPTRAGYTPSRPPSSDPKYSTAQVRKRIGNDGTVAPVTEPKKTKDGLYMRPAGRQRKGMQWDSLRGIWVPQGQLA